MLTNIFQKKKFEIRSVGAPAGRKFTYYTESDIKSKYLLTLSRNTHMFQMAIQPKLMEIRHLEEEGMYCMYFLIKGSYMSAHVLLNL